MAKGNGCVYKLWLCPSAVASAHLDGRERSVLRPCLCVMWSTAPLLCVPTAPPASLSQVDIPASAPLGLQGSTASKVAPLNTSCIIRFFTYLSHKMRPPLFNYLTAVFALSAVTITDPFFSGNLSSWMSFAPMSIRHRTVLQLQFQPLSPEGILVYTAQHLSARSGEDHDFHSSKGPLY